MSWRILAERFLFHMRGGDKHKNGRNLNWNKDISKSKNTYL